MTGGVAGLVGKTLAGLLMLLALALMPLPAGAHGAAAPPSQGYQHSITAAVRDEGAAPCSNPACVDGPACNVGMSCSVVAAQFGNGPVALPAPPVTARASLPIVQAVFHAGTDTTPTPPPPRPVI